MKNKKQLIVTIRGIISSLLIIVFSILAITGSIFFFKSKEKISLIHPILGFLMIVLVGIHLILNYNMLFSELKIIFKKKGG